MGDGIVLEVTQWNSSYSMRALLDIAGQICDAFGLVFEMDWDLNSPKNAMHALNPYLIEQRTVVEWPGSESEQPQLLALYSVSNESLNALARVLPDPFRLYDWYSPHDLHFIRPDGSAALLTISDLEEAWFELRSDEIDSIDANAMQLLGLREPPAPLTIHATAARGDRANAFVIFPAQGDSQFVEQLVCSQVGPYLFELCCIPFHADQLALGDILAAIEEGGHWKFQYKAAASGRRVVDVYISSIRRSPQEVASLIESSGLLMEWSSYRSIVVDVADGDIDRLYELFETERKAAGVSIVLRD